MKAHELARALLAGPDVEVLTAFDQAPEQATSLGEPKIEVRLGWDSSVEDNVPVDCVVLYHRNDGDMWSSEVDHNLDGRDPFFKNT